MANLVSRYAGKVAGVVKTVAKGAGAYIKEAATSGNEMKAIDQQQAQKAAVAKAQKASMGDRYYNPQKPVTGAKPK